MTLVADEYLKPVTSLSCEKAALSLCSPRGFHLFGNAGVILLQEIGTGVGFEWYDGFSAT
jgi:hypothetical protein